MHIWRLFTTKRIPTGTINANIQLVKVIIYDIIRMLSVSNSEITSVSSTNTYLSKNVLLIRIKGEYMIKSKTTNLAGVIIPLLRKVI